MEYIEIMGNENMFSIAVQSVVNWYNNHIGKETLSFITKEDVCVVWFAKTLQNFKVMLSVPLLCTEFYEFTYNGDNKEAYLDVYTKIENQVIKFHE